MMSDIAKLLQQSDKAEFLEWVQEHITDAEKCFVAMAKPDGTGLEVAVFQVGHRYKYELVGFVDWLQRFMDMTESDDDDRESE